MPTTIDWDKAAAALKRDVVEHGGFLTIQKDSLRDRFEIGRLTERISGDLVYTLDQHGMIIVPHPYYKEWTSLRVYDVESEIGKIVLAVDNPQDVPERALIDVVELYRRANAGKDRRSDDVPWLSALDVFLQLVIGKPPEGWEDLDDDREPFELREALAASLGLPADIVHSKEIVRIAGAVCACRPHRYRLEGSPPGLGAALAEAGRKQKEGFDAVLLEAAKHLLEGAEIPSRPVEMGRLGLRYRHEAKGGVGWLR
jgi:hypothetical protein